MPQPAQFRNVFFFVSGRTPQIITETLFFFLKRQRPPIRPHEIHVLTTMEGQALIRRHLLAPGGGQFLRFCTEFRLNPAAIRFSEQTVEVLRDGQGRPLRDIRTAADNRAAADQIVAKVRALTADPHVRLLASLAGGRKTMGLYLGFALQFYGRPHDRLTHVLISPPELENNPHFFYPSEHGPHAQPGATVTVAEVPLILLGHKLPVLRTRLALSFATLVEHSQREVDLLTSLSPLTVDPLGRRLQIGAVRIPLSGLEFALYVLIAHKRHQAPCAPECAGCEACSVATADFLRLDTIRLLEAIATEVGVRDPRVRQLRWWAQEGEEGKKRFLQVSARIKRKIAEAVGEASVHYAITPLHVRRGRSARYTISLPKRFVRLPALATLPAR